MASNVSELLNKISEQISSSSVSTLSDLDYDLLLQDIRNLYEAVKKERNNTTKPHIQPETSKTEVVAAVIHEPEVKEVTPPILEEALIKKQEPVVEVIAPKKKITPSVSINETSSVSESLNEKLKTGKTEVHKKFSAKPLKDLIDLNKRFVLVKELFDGNSDALVQTVSKIDALDDFTAAQSFIQNEVSNTYQWDLNTQSAKLFLKLVKQKFGEE